MPSRESTDTDSRFRERSTVEDEYEAIRSAIREMEAREVARQLPNLVETVVSESTPPEDTVKFIIGISFSKNETLLDYRLERLVQLEESERLYLDVIKPAVTHEHHYITFAYPPDPHFDAAALRGALLVALERGFERGGARLEPTDTDSVDETGLSGRLSDIWRRIGQKS